MKINRNWTAYGMMSWVQGSKSGFVVLVSHDMAEVTSLPTGYVHGVARKELDALREAGFDEQTAMRNGSWKADPAPHETSTCCLHSSDATASTSTAPPSNTRSAAVAPKDGE